MSLGEDVLRKRLIVAASAVSVVAVIVAFIVVSYQISPGGETVWNSVIEPQITYKAILNVNGYVSNSYWTRNSVTDLPNYVSTVFCSVTNTGNSHASNVNLEIKVDGNVMEP